MLALHIHGICIVERLNYRMVEVLKAIVQTRTIKGLKRGV